MFVRKKLQASGNTSIQVIDKQGGKSGVIKTICCSSDVLLINQFIVEEEEYILSQKGLQQFDFSDYSKVYKQVFASIISHKLVGVQLTIGKLFDEIGLNAIKDPLFKDLVLYRIIYPKSKLRTTEYLYRYEQKEYTEDDIYRYMDKLHQAYKAEVEQISYHHSLKILGGKISTVFYDVTAIYFEVYNEDDLRKTGFSKNGKHQHPQIVLGLHVSTNGYPLAYEIFQGNQFECETMLPVLDALKTKYNIVKAIVVADSGLLSKSNIEKLIVNQYEFILGARIKNETNEIKERILSLKLVNGESVVIEKSNLNLVITYSASRAKKDRHCRDKGLKRLEKLIRSGKLTKSQLNKRGYNKFLKKSGNVEIEIDKTKLEEEAKWDGLKGYLSNAPLTKDEIIENYNHLWHIDKAFRVAKTDLKIRPIYHRLQRRIEAHICLNFVAYKIYKELERRLKEMKAELSAEKVIEIAKNIFEIQALQPDNQITKQTLIITQEQKTLAKLFGF